MRTAGIAIVLATLLAACTTLRGSDRPKASEELGTWMTGVFSSALQASADPENFFDVRLVMMPIWEDREDGPWLYVEQAVGEALERPYRQRVYHLVDIAGGARSDVYELPGDPLGFARAWERKHVFGDIAPEDLVLRDGCSIYLTRGMDEVSYVGATRGTGCASSLGGAHHATSEVVIRPDFISSWDRGFDDEGLQVWGATEGPYQFDRIDPLF